MRYQISETPHLLGQFTSGDTVTISLYDLSDSSAETLTSNACAEVSTTGIFKWSTAQITAQPTVLTEYLWIMNNGSTDQRGKIVLGGYVEDIDGKISEIEIDTTDLEREVSIIANNTQPACGQNRGGNQLATERGVAIINKDGNILITI